MKILLYHISITVSQDFHMRPIGEHYQGIPGVIFPSKIL